MLGEMSDDLSDVTDTSSGQCPHCGERIESVEAFDRHLAERHFLRPPDGPPPPRPRSAAATLEGIAWLVAVAFGVLLFLGLIPIQVLAILIAGSALFLLYRGVIPILLGVIMVAPCALFVLYLFVQYLLGTSTF